MEVNKSLFGYEDNLVSLKSLYDGLRFEFKFPNNYGASVVRHFGSYGNERGLWELAVLKYRSNGEYFMVYDTPITGDVIGYLTETKVNHILTRIKDL